MHTAPRPASVFFSVWKHASLYGPAGTSSRDVAMFMSASEGVMIAIGRTSCPGGVVPAGRLMTTRTTRLNMPRRRFSPMQLAVVLLASAVLVATAQGM